MRMRVHLYGGMVDELNFPNEITAMDYLSDTFGFWERAILLQVVTWQDDDILPKHFV